jgi:hypothetical protein
LFFSNRRRIYFQSIAGYSAIVSGALILPLIISTSAWSIGSGQFMSRVGRYMPCVAVGFALWLLGNGLTTMFNSSTQLWALILILIVAGAGVGLTLQPSKSYPELPQLANMAMFSNLIHAALVGMYANSKSEDRAVVTGLRNFIRTIGGAFGLISKRLSPGGVVVVAVVGRMI